MFVFRQADFRCDVIVYKVNRNTQLSLNSLQSSVNGCEDVFARVGNLVKKSLNLKRRERDLEAEHTESS